MSLARAARALCLTGAATAFFALGRDRAGAGRFDPLLLLDEIRRERNDVDLLPRQLFDAAQIGTFFLITEREGDAVIARTRGAPDAVDILLRDVGEVEIDDMAHPRHVNAARGDVGGDEQLDRARTELGERLFALRLALIAVDRVRGDAVRAEQLHDTVGAMFGAAEDQRAIDFVIFEEERQQRLLFLLIDERDVLFDALGGRRYRRDLHLDRIGQEAARKVADRLRHGGRKEEALPVGRQHLHDALQ